ncbi:MAG: cation/H(+) antiporter, partial [Bacteroides sp.]
SRYQSDAGNGGALPWLSLFRDKVEEVKEQVTCTVAVLVNRNYREDLPTAFVLGGRKDLFLFPYLEQLLIGGVPVHV